MSNIIYNEVLDLNLEAQRKTAHYMHEYVKRMFNGEIELNGQLTLSTKLFDRYNYLMYPLPGVHELYNNIKRVFHSINVDPYDDYFIQCWLNFYYKGDFIDWHGHWPTEAHSWHGFYCVDVEPDSYTDYKFKDTDSVTRVKSQDNLLVISRSGNDVHRSSEWTEDKPRITIAFDIVPAEKLFDAGAYRNPNHWIPI